MRKFYYYVEPCPSCGSPRTGRYAPATLFGSSDRMALESLKHGELVRPCAQAKRENLFCDSCGYEWAGRVKAELWRDEDIKADQERRGTLTMYEDYQTRHSVEDEPKRGFWASLLPRIGTKKEPVVDWGPQEPTRKKIKKGSSVEVLYLDQNLLETILSD